MARRWQGDGGRLTTQGGWWELGKVGIGRLVPGRGGLDSTRPLSPIFSCPSWSRGDACLPVKCHPCTAIGCTLVIACSVQPRVAARIGQPPRAPASDSPSSMMTALESHWPSHPSLTGDGRVGMHDLHRNPPDFVASDWPLPPRIKNGCSRLDLRGLTGVRVVVRPFSSINMG